MIKGTLRVCDEGHRYYKSSDCPVCPECESGRSRPDFMSGLAAPARRALESAGIRDLKDLTRFSEKELLALHGFGPSSLPPLRSSLRAAKLQLRK